MTRDCRDFPRLPGIFRASCAGQRVNCARRPAQTRGKPDELKEKRTLCRAPQNSMSQRKNT
jgi:hypothetical protein